MRYLVGIIGFPLGFVVIIYREKVKNFLGNIELAEKWLGPGGTYTAVILIGLLISVGSLMWMFGTLQGAINAIVAPLNGNN